MDGNHIPWAKKILVDSDKTLNVVFHFAEPIIVNNEYILENSVGPWCIENENILKSQSNTFYSNSDVATGLQWIESDLFDVNGTNRLTLSMTHRYETEWDHDYISISFLMLTIVFCPRNLGAEITGMALNRILLMLKQILFFPK